jgi:hypothetical protein
MSGKKRSIEGFCFDCDLDFAVKVSEDDVRSLNIDTIHCPFCGEEIEADSEDESEDYGDEYKED